MSLNFNLKINEFPIGYFEAVRIEGDADPESVNEYRVRLFSNRRMFWEGFVLHRYGDGAWVLVAKSIQEWLNEHREYPGIPGEVHPQGG